MRLPAWPARLLVLLGLAVFGSSQSAVADGTRLTLAVGGKTLFYYLPLTLAERLGYLREAGLEIEIVDFAGGAKSLQALLGGSAEVVAGSFEHVVNMRARGQALSAFVLLARYPAIVLAAGRALASGYRSPADLRGRRVGITAPGSSTHMFLNHVLARAGVPASEVPVIGVGAGASAVAAMRRGEIDALVHLDPVIEELVAAGAAQPVLDTRAPEGAAAVYGGTYHAACLYARAAWLEENPAAAAALARAMVRALRWLAAATDEEILAAVPKAYWARDPALWKSALGRNRAIWSPDGQLDDAGARHVIDTLASFEEFVRQANLEPQKLMDGRFVAQALRQ